MAVGYDYYEAAKLIIDAGGDPGILNIAGFPACKGLEGDKSLGIAALISAQTSEEALNALNICEQKTEDLDKASFIAAGLKVKKQLKAEWTDVHQEKFKAISAKI
eukprot:gene22638-23854_t